jgi:cardiolipin synthase
VGSGIGRDLAATLIFVSSRHSPTGWTAISPASWHQTSAFGAFLDPVADKLMVAAALIVLVQLGRLDAIVAMIIIGREITISALREWMAKIGAHKSVAVSMIGKIKTTAQMMAIPMLLYYAPEAWNRHEGTSALADLHRHPLTLWSMGYYMRMAWPHLIEEDRALKSRASGCSHVDSPWQAYNAHSLHAGVAQLVERYLAKV